MLNLELVQVKKIVKTEDEHLYTITAYPTKEKDKVLVVVEGYYSTTPKVQSDHLVDASDLDRAIEMVIEYFQRKKESCPECEEELDSSFSGLSPGELLALCPNNCGQH